MNIHLLGGFLGSGKTTAIQQAVMILQQQAIKAGVIVNDQGSQLVDGAFFNSLQYPMREVVNGCFCCRYHDLEAGIQSLKEEQGAEVVFAETVGSCTDIVATVVKPLLQYRPADRVSLSVFADARLLPLMLSGQSPFDAAIQYIYLKQLEEAGLIVVSKIDLVKADQLSFIKKALQTRFRGKQVLYQNSLLFENVNDWLAAVSDESALPGYASLSVDYDRYGEGEAKMGWFDQVLEFRSEGSAMQQAEKLISIVYKKAQSAGHPIGHIKFLTDTGIKVSYTSAQDAAVALQHAPANKVSLLVNIRMQMEPEDISQLVEQSILEVEANSETKVMRNPAAAFRPSYPKPTYRIHN